jgi:hypothetical protein
MMAQQPKDKMQEQNEPTRDKAPPAPGEGGRELTEEELTRAVVGDGGPRQRKAARCGVAAVGSPNVPSRGARLALR